MTFEQWQTAIGLIGLPAVLILCIGFAVWKWGWYLLTDILKPLSERLIAFFTELEQQVEKLVASTERMCDQMEQHGDQLDDHGKKLDEHSKKLDDILKK